MTIHEINRKIKTLCAGHESLSNHTEKAQEMEVSPPPESVNYDGKSVFFDSVHIKPAKTGSKQISKNDQVSFPCLQVGGTALNDELSIPVQDQGCKITADKASDKASVQNYDTPQMKANGKRLGLSLIHI